ncbi:hypothetical protein [Natronobiforma cellulositropha]|uniref:hypothetical protein n=1 Tax=Natronobiforma cellulositropha TaxID=1679076 RepID=UPI0021D5DB90|nr:hypothetical protein [Natronobiforma cellulositropha]
MSTTDPDQTAETPFADDSTDGARDDARAELAAQVELLTEENRRLRREYARARQSRYRRTAYALAAVGVLAAVGGVLFVDGRDVLFALAATGLFAAALTYYLSPAGVVAADVGERVYAAMAVNEAAIADELGLRDDRIYVPGGDEETTLARLFVPQRAGYEIPVDPTAPIVTGPTTRGLVLETTGTGLFGEFQRALTGDLSHAPAPLAGQLSDALVEQFELVTSAETDVDGTEGRATVAVSESAFGDVDRFDHPVASFLAVGFAVGLGRPVELEVARGDGRADWLVTCRWSLEE